MKILVFYGVAILLAGCIDQSPAHYEDNDSSHVFEQGSSDNPATQEFNWSASGYANLDFPLNGTGAFDIQVKQQGGQMLNMVFGGDEIECSDAGMNPVISTGNGTSTTKVRCTTNADSPMLEAEMVGFAAGEFVIRFQ